MIKENGEITLARDEIITICQTFYRKLYEQKTPDQPTTLTSSPDKEKIPPFLEEEEEEEKEVKETLNEIKKKKAPGNDGITSDVMKIGGRGPQVIKYMTKVYNEVLKKHIPREKDNGWTKRCTEWQPRSERRDRGRPEARWMDDIRRTAGPQWQRKAQDRRKLKTSAEGYILQWMDKASK
ncbi:endonuclease-reverse transcriptase [Plakobranchus ocellatus]|uniref:Endonuclease-reverse transcriptase n=1 Tax=Plakobranchus ocellatus TaxID=259542 RepID=A0AAV4AI87_9GAST|nr:endonuclease-reverse transcriptase [Plakobranchus ocellatus]